MVPLAHGSDGGGSIRIPAACCGLVGLKPSRGRVSRGPEQGDDFLVQDGVLTRTVAETAALLDVLAGYEPGDATWAPPPAEPFAAAAGARARPAAHRRRRRRPPIDAPLDPLCERAVRDAAELLASLGHEVEEIDRALGRPGPARGVHAGVRHADRDGPVLRRPGERPRAGRGAGRAALLDDLEGHPRAQRARLPARPHAARARSRAAIVALWNDYDVVLTPGAGAAPGADRRDRRVQRRARGRTSGAPASSRPTRRSST